MGLRIEANELVRAKRERGGVVERRNLGGVVTRGNRGHAAQRSRDADRRGRGRAGAAGDTPDTECRRDDGERDRVPLHTVQYTARVRLVPGDVSDYRSVAASDFAAAREWSPSTL